MGFTTSYWQKERWSHRAADTLTSYGRSWNPSLGNWNVNWSVCDQDCVRTAMKQLFKPGRSAAQTCVQIRKQFHQLGRNALADSSRKDMRRGDLNQQCDL